jgi:hypothetical protein
MYNIGQGDCFLLAFPATDGETRYMLIDFGAQTGERVEAIARDIMETTGGKLHVAAVTHEHVDHLSGFGLLGTVLKDIAIDSLWLAWTEDPANPLVEKLKDLAQRRIKLVQEAITRMKQGDRQEKILQLMSPEDMYIGPRDGGILDLLRKKCASEAGSHVTYLAPGGKPLEIPGVQGIRCFVLAPPCDLAFFEVPDSREETYALFPGINEEAAFAAALFPATDVGGADSFPSFKGYPFDKIFSVSEEVLKADNPTSLFFKRYYGFTDDPSEGPSWRRIDEDWLAFAETLALKIGEMTNNTSLVLAFEMTEATPRKILLFAADAQIGSWLSWHTLKWPGEDPGEKDLTGEDLIRRTVFYKVGHHGSVNATPREKGLELMENPDLVAMISVDEEWAHRRKWMHPWQPLEKRLFEMTRGRVIRSDQVRLKGLLPRPPEIPEQEWNTFAQCIDWEKSQDPLWIQYTIRL